MAKGKTVKAEEISRFSALSDEWWNTAGPMAPLHKLNPVRLDYIKRKIAAHFKALKNLNIVDIGCAAGLVSENLATWGADKKINVTGIDASEQLITAAQHHAQQSNVAVTYRHADVDTLVTAKEKYDVVLALEIIEHVDEQAHFVRQAAKLLDKNGLMIVSTLNRSPKGFLLGIVGAEYILRWLPRGTHDWRQFVKPSELSRWLSDAGLNTDEIVGLCYNPLRGSFSINPSDVDVNYLICASR
ncbi:MAG: bifunctional 2-polyprenyl-6-hydroxyphenol methylase/3-demethylubiquinol 3-O-methyltransferase UbiG [Alphaproteobacteria bacterium]|nr:bifunctional 2-polyprenyl-6-hydroxyphenol methylase/3-demethylubiquinol 3-O-methyltransferase UbiG [Alphaproteobacteria bacterium]